MHSRTWRDNLLWTLETFIASAMIRTMSNIRTHMTQCTTRPVLLRPTNEALVVLSEQHEDRLSFSGITVITHARFVPSFILAREAHIVRIQSSQICQELLRFWAAEDRF